jgi:hypothetical protein
VADDDTPFLSRWARRKAAAREGVALPDPPPASSAASTTTVPPTLPPTAPVAEQPAPLAESPAALPAKAPPAPTLDEVALLGRESDYTRFVARGVTPEVKNAALKKLFADPRFNVMDGLDTYIDDYGKPDPLPASWLRQMVQSKVLGLFDDESEEAQKVNAAPPLAVAPRAPESERHEDPDLQLQPDDDAGRAGAAPGAEQDSGRPD